MAVPEHDCEWKERHEALAAEHRTLAESLTGLQHEFEKLKRQLLVPESEKMPRVTDELRSGKKANPAETQRERRERTEARKRKLEKKTPVHPVPAAQRQCPKCGSEKLKPLGKDKESVVYEYVPAHFVANRHLRETLACPCGEHVVTAHGPAKLVEKSQYAPSFVASIITSKCANSIPLYRLEKELQRIGVPV